MTEHELSKVPPVIDVVVPVHNEERALPVAIEQLTAHLATFPWAWRITIADNASTDATGAVAQDLCDRYPGVHLVSLPVKGRGLALKHAWMRSDAEVLVYMDVDLSTDLKALLPLVAPLVSGHSDMAIGSRLGRGSRVTRGAKRELVSRVYNALLKTALHTGFADAQCGFKAVRRDVATAILPLVRDNDWFFDTELLVLAERAGLRIHEVDVDWVDDLDSRVDVVRAALDDLRGIRRLAWSLLTGRDDLGRVSRLLGSARNDGRASAQLILFIAIGVLSTVSYSLLYLLLRHSFSDQASNALALLTTTIVNTAANRRLTFGIRGTGAWKNQAQGMLVLGVGLGLTSGTLWALGAFTGGSAPVLAEVLAVTAANLVATAVRFIAMRSWIFRRRAEHPDTAPPEMPSNHMTPALAQSPARG